MDNTEFVNVSIRIKPVAEIENPTLCVISAEPPVLLMVDRPQTFTFDNIFEEVSQELFYDKTVKPFVQYVKQGYNCTVFAYGQTGTGKTYTMGINNAQNEEDFGLIPRALNDFFEDNEEESETEIAVSFIEIYNEKVFDLLKDTKKLPLPVKGFKVQGISREKVFNFFDAQHFLQVGNRNRHTAGTKQNSQSSRSHAIFSIYCNVKQRNIETAAKLNLVDLAGCESVKKTGSYGTTFHEGISINRGLLSIGQVMSALSSNASFIPYRQSIITSILQDSLNKQNFVSLIACVSPLVEDSTETIQTLDFAQRVKKISSKPEVNEVVSQYKRENPHLFSNRVQTPFKRPLTMQTPCKFNKRQVMTILEHDCSNSTTDPDRSLKSVSSISNTDVRFPAGLDITQQVLSPIIRKYMDTMESSLMDKLGSMIKTTLQTPVLANRFDTELAPKPNLSWGKIQNEVSKMVQSEFVQLSSKTVRSTSCPIEEQLDDIRRVLNYDCSPEIELCCDEEFVFKVPLLRTKKGKMIENIVPRRSNRLSIKRMSIVANDKSHDTFGDDKENSQECFDIDNSTVLRSTKSIRLSKSYDREAQNTRKNRKRLLTVKTPTGKKMCRGIQEIKDSPMTSHTKKILETINSGDSTQIEKLSTIGPKTAQQLILFRKMKGELNEINSLRQMPGWGDKRYKKFLEQNFLKEFI